MYNMGMYAAGDGRCVALIIGSFGVCVVVGVIHVVFCCRLFIDVLVRSCDCRHVRFIVAAGGGSRCDV